MTIPLMRGGRVAVVQLSGGLPTVVEGSILFYGDSLMGRRVAWLLLVAAVLVPFTGCTTAQLDADGDGVVTENDLVTLVINWLTCDQGTGTTTTTTK
jgi:hypothetical protein